LSLAGEWDLLLTEAILLMGRMMLDEAAVMAYHDGHLAIVLSSLLSLTVTLFLRTSSRQRG
jgi:hypothetical protein